MREETRRDALFALTDIFRDLNSPDEIIFKASEMLGTNLKVSRVGYGTTDVAAETLSWTATGTRPASRRSPAP